MKNIAFFITFLILATSNFVLAQSDLDQDRVIFQGMYYFNKATLELNDEKGDLNIARQYLEKAEAIFKKNQKEDYLANTYVKQANIYFRIHHIDQAQLCLDLASRLSASKRTSLTLELAKTKLERLKGNKESALSNALNAEKIAHCIGDYNQIKRVERLIEILQQPTSSPVSY